MPATASPRTVPAAGPRAMLRVLTDLAAEGAVAPIARVPDLDPELDVIGAVLQPTRFLAVPLSRRERQRIGALLEQLGLTRRLGRRPGGLPIDDLRRIAVARAVAARATVVVLDDPAHGLDAPAADALLRDLRTAAEQQGFALILLRPEGGETADRRAAA